jgi:hypothetical protein
MKNFVEALIYISTISFFVGLMAGVTLRSCEPESILSTIAIPYRLGCELTVPRYKK